MAMAASLSLCVAASPPSRCVSFKAVAAGAQRQQAQWNPRPFSCGLSIGLKRNGRPSRGGRISVSCNARAALKLADAELVSLQEPDFLRKIPSSQGIYAVYDKEGTLQYIGISGRIAASVQGHAKDLSPELCSSVKVTAVHGADRDGLRQAWEAWLREHVDLTGKPPAGNLPGNTIWKKPPKGDLKLKPSASTELNIPLEQLIDKVVKSHEVVAFINGSRTAPQCEESRHMLTLLYEQGLEYETVNALDEEHNSGVAEALKAYSGWPTIPLLYVGGEYIGGAEIFQNLINTAVDGKLFKISRPRRPKPKPKSQAS